MIDLSAIDLSTMYSSLIKRLVRTVGVHDTLIILRKRGGTRIALPLNPTGDLVADFGESVVAKLIAEFEGGTRITLPVSDKIELQLRNAAIWLEEDEGASLSEQALRYKLTMRQITTIRQLRHKKHQTESPQRDLFTAADKAG